MSDLSSFNASMRVDAIRTVMRNRPALLESILDDNGTGIDLSATPEALDCGEPEDILVRLAWDIWNGTGETEFNKVLEQLPVEDYVAFIDAMTVIAKLREKIYHAHSTGLEND